MKNILIITIALFVLLINNYAQELNGWKLNGQIQLRSELDGRDFSNKTHALTFASLRTRLGVEKTFDQKVQLFVQFQDSRVFGEEGNPNSDIKNVDLHQGYVKLFKPFNLDLNVKAGRFEMSYGTERFFGASNWSYTGRAYDGVLFTFLPDDFDMNLFALTLNESNNYISNAFFLSYPYPESASPSHSIYGLEKLFSNSEKSKYELIAYYENNRFKTNQGDDALKMFTLAGTYWGTYGLFSTIVEAAYQFGKMGDMDISSYLLSLSGDYNINNATVGAGVDLLSGTKNTSNDFNTFMPTYGTGHKFYGYMDYFTNIPINTLFAGLNDFYADFNYLFVESKLSFGAALHHFMSNKPILISTTTNPDGNEENTFGQELDLTLKYDFVKGTSITWGGSLFFPCKIMKAFFAPREDTAFWTYIMITANL